MAALGLLAVHKCIACHHFKQSTTRRDHLEAFNCRREVLQQIGRRTDGSGCVVSLYTVFDTDLVLLHSSLLSLVGLSAQQMRYTAGDILAASPLFVKPGARGGVCGATGGLAPNGLVNANAHDRGPAVESGASAFSATTAARAKDSAQTPHSNNAPGHGTFPVHFSSDRQEQFQSCTGAGFGKER